MTWIANPSDPGLGFSWVAPDFDDSGWNAGVYGAGYEIGGAPNALELIQTEVPTDSISVYTRAVFNVADVTQIHNLALGADYDDGYVAWLNGVEIFRAYRAWGPGLGLSLGATVFGGLGAHYLEHGAFAWSLERPAELLGWLTFFAMWVSNIKLEVWTLEPLRKLDRERGLTDEAAFEAATAPVARHLLVHAALVLAVVVLARLAA